uniref:hypothetical protein n=1 Tax=Nonomuraea sp. CA-251285 TaxID=3240002 RepID=UPI003F491C9B
MTHPGLLVTLDRSLDAETAGTVAALLRQIKGVVDVSPVTGDPQVEQMIRMQVDSTWRESIRPLLYRQS